MPSHSSTLLRLSVFRASSLCLLMPFCLFCPNYKHSGRKFQNYIAGGCFQFLADTTDAVCRVLLFSSFFISSFFFFLSSLWFFVSSIFSHLWRLLSSCGISTVPVGWLASLSMLQTLFDCLVVVFFMFTVICRLIRSTLFLLLFLLLWCSTVRMHTCLLFSFLPIVDT